MPLHCVEIDIQRGAYVLDANFLIDLYSDRDVDGHERAKEFRATQTNVQFLIPQSSLSEAFYKVQTQKSLGVAHEMLMDIDTPGTFNLIGTTKYSLEGTTSVSQKFGVDYTDSDITNFVRSFHDDFGPPLLEIVTRDIRDFIPICSAYKLKMFDYYTQQRLDFTRAR